MSSYDINQLSLMAIHRQLCTVCEVLNHQLHYQLLPHVYDSFNYVSPNNCKKMCHCKNITTYNT